MYKLIIALSFMSLTSANFQMQTKSLDNSGILSGAFTNISVAETLTNNGKIEGTQAVTLSCKSLVGKGTIKGPMITIETEEFGFKGTISCDKLCMIRTKHPVKKGQCKTVGKGKFVYTVIPTLDVTKKEEPAQKDKGWQNNPFISWWKDMKGNAKDGDQICRISIQLDASKRDDQVWSDIKKSAKNIYDFLQWGKGFAVNPLNTLHEHINALRFAEFETNSIENIRCWHSVKIVSSKEIDESIDKDLTYSSISIGIFAVNCDELVNAVTKQISTRELVQLIFDYLKSRPGKGCYFYVQTPIF